MHLSAVLLRVDCVMGRGWDAGNNGRNQKDMIYVLISYFANLLWNLDTCFQFLDETGRLIHQKFIVGTWIFVGQQIKQISPERRFEEAEEFILKWKRKKKWWMSDHEQFWKGSDWMQQLMAQHWRIRQSNDMFKIL